MLAAKPHLPVLRAQRGPPVDEAAAVQETFKRRVLAVQRANKRLRHICDPYPIVLTH